VVWILRNLIRPRHAAAQDIKWLKGETMNAIFDLCVAILVTLAERFSMTYQEVNVWIFVILWPILTLILVGVILRQHLLIKRLRRNHLVRERLGLTEFEQ
jgi:hypothetical protein